jgi:hypothetical protein
VATTLTPRQQEIKSLLDKGKSAKQIAKSLKISENAVHQHKRRMGITGNAAKPAATRSRSTTRRSGSGGGSQRTRTRATGGRQSRSTPRPTPAPAAAPAHVTPLQSVRHRRDEINHELRDVRTEHENAVKAAEKAAEVLAKAESRYADELKQLDAAEAALTGKAPEPAKPARQASRSRNGSGSKGQGKAAAEKVAEGTPAAPLAAEAPDPEPEPTPAEAAAQDEAAEAPDSDQEFERPGVPVDPEFEQAEAAAAFGE